MQTVIHIGISLIASNPFNFLFRSRWFEASHQKLMTSNGENGKDDKIIKACRDENKKLL